jgi:hypothetical protein
LLKIAATMMGLALTGLAGDFLHELAKTKLKVLEEK